MFKATVEFSQKGGIPPLGLLLQSEYRRCTVLSVSVLSEKRHFAAVPDDDRKARSREVALRFGENLRRARRRAGISQDELAARASLHRTEIGMLENGQRVARITTLIQLAGAVGVEPAELIAGINWAPGGVLGGSFGFDGPAGER
jgi:ribosome-binding protein aMBF1 (putative translation factor)